MAEGYNKRCPAVKRILREAQEMHIATEEYFAQPLEDNLFEWHFTVRGPIDSDFQDGIYHGRIILPNEYPMKPPNIIFTTINGRFETNKKICLSISGYHPETWQPSWSIRTALLAIIGYMPSHAPGTIASLDYSSEERKMLAKKSWCHVCPQCGPVNEVLLPRNVNSAAAFNLEARNISSQMSVTEKPLYSENTENPANISITAAGTEETQINADNSTETFSSPEGIRQRQTNIATDTPVKASATAANTTVSSPTVTSSTTSLHGTGQVSASAAPAAAQVPLRHAANHHAHGGLESLFLYACCLIFVVLLGRRMIMLTSAPSPDDFIV